MRRPPAWARAQLDEASETLTWVRESEPLLERLVAGGIVANLAWVSHELGCGRLQLGRFDEARVA